MTLPHHPTTPPLLLASASPRRQRLLREAGVAFEVAAVAATEISIVGDPAATVSHNARAKHDACRALHPAAAILAADTLVWFEGELIGKPRDFDEAAAFLRAFAGRTQSVYTALALSLPTASTATLHVEVSDVTFLKLSEATITRYLATAQPLDRAGAYDIDEQVVPLIAGYSGSYSNIVGLPLEPLLAWLRANLPGVMRR